MPSLFSHYRMCSLTIECVLSRIRFNSANPATGHLAIISIFLHFLSTGQVSVYIYYIMLFLIFITSSVYIYYIMLFLIFIVFVGMCLCVALFFIIYWYVLYNIINWYLSMFVVLYFLLVSVYV